jgi:hypothetical protein
MGRWREGFATREGFHKPSRLKFQKYPSVLSPVRLSIQLTVWNNVWSSFRESNLRQNPCDMISTLGMDATPSMVKEL